MVVADHLTKKIRAVECEGGVRNIAKEKGINIARGTCWRGDVQSQDLNVGPLKWGAGCSTTSIRPTPLEIGGLDRKNVGAVCLAVPQQQAHRHYNFGNDVIGANHVYIKRTLVTRPVRIKG